MSFPFRSRTIRRIGVIGSGQIGPDIALYFAKTLSGHGVPVVVVDVVEEALARGRDKVAKKIAKGVETGAFTADQQAAMLRSLEFTTDYGRLADADLVVEAATEDRNLKRKIFAKLESICPRTALFASNSSHLEPGEIFAELGEKGRCMVIHYFFPAERNPVVEIVPADFTDRESKDFAMAFYEAIGKVPIAVGSRYGYALDPIFEGLFLTAALLLESGAGTSRQIDHVARSTLGLAVGPFTAMNLTGGNPITEIGLSHYGTRIHSWFRVPDVLRKAVAGRTPWEVPGRGETVEVPAEAAARIRDDLLGAYFGLAGEVLDSGIVSLADLDMALELALDVKPAFRFMNEMGTGRALALVRSYAERHPGFPVPRCIAEAGARNAPFQIPVVLREDRGDTAVITIRRPRVLNALDAAVFEQLERIFAEVKTDARIRSAVLTGFGVKAFVSGADVRMLARIETPAQGAATSRGSQATLRRIETLGKPVVCALNGLAFGGGAELAMACTARICRSGLRVLFAQPEPSLGIIPGAGGTQRLPRLVGLVRAAELLRTGRTVSSAEALAMGFVVEETEGDLVARAVEMAREIASGKRTMPPMPEGPLPDVPRELPPVDIGHRSRKVDEILCSAILDGARGTLTQGFEVEALAFGDVCATRDMRIGVENFVNNGPRSKAIFVHA